MDAVTQPRVNRYRHVMTRTESRSRRLGRRQVGLGRRGLGHLGTAALIAASAATMSAGTAAAGPPPEVGQPCSGAEIGRKVIDSKGRPIMCINYRWQIYSGQRPSRLDLLNRPSR